MVYTKTIIIFIHLSVGESDGYPSLFTSTSVDNAHGDVKPVGAGGKAGHRAGI